MIKRWGTGRLNPHRKMLKDLQFVHLNKDIANIFTKPSKDLIKTVKHVLSRKIVHLRRSLL